MGRHLGANAGRHTGLAGSSCRLFVLRQQPCDSETCQKGAGSQVDGERKVHDPGQAYELVTVRVRCLHLRARPPQRCPTCPRRTRTTGQGVHKDRAKPPPGAQVYMGRPGRSMPAPSTVPGVHMQQRQPAQRATGPHEPRTMELGTRCRLPLAGTRSPAVQPACR